MSAPDRPELDQLRLSDAAARRLLARASELDVAHGRMVTISNLREAAIEAGISTQAFDAALRELQQQSAAQSVAAAAQARAAGPRWRHARTASRVAVAVAVVLLILGARFVSRARVPEPTSTEITVTPSSVPTTEVRVDTVVVGSPRAR